MAKIVGAPFIKVEATKFTEVGYVGRDVESMVRDLVDVAVRLVKNQKKAMVKDEAVAKANDKLVKLLVPSMKKKAAQGNNPLENLLVVPFQILEITKKMRKNHQQKKLKLNALK